MTMKYIQTQITQSIEMETVSPPKSQFYSSVVPVPFQEPIKQNAPQQLVDL